MLSGEIAHKNNHYCHYYYEIRYKILEKSVNGVVSECCIVLVELAKNAIN